MMMFFINLALMNQPKTYLREKREKCVLYNKNILRITNMSSVVYTKTIENFNIFLAHRICFLIRNKNYNEIKCQRKF